MMAGRKKRRRWSDDEKRMICSQTRVPGVSVAQVGRRYGLNANQIFNWLKNPKFAVDENNAAIESQFLPVEIIDEPVPTAPTLDCVQMAVPSSELQAPKIRINSGLIELELTSGHRLRISGDYDPDAIGRLVRSLS